MATKSATIKQLKWSSWSTLPISRYEKIREILRSDTEHPDVEILAVLCDCDLDTILNMPMVELMALKEQAMFIGKPIKIKDRLSFDSIKIDGTKYIINADFRKVTTAQFIDFQTFYKDYENHYANVLACIIVPEGHTYNDGYDALELADTFKEKLDIETAENVCFFFARRSERSLKSAMTSLIFRMAKMAMKTRDRRIVEAMKEIAKEREHITGLGKLMKSLIRN